MDFSRISNSNSKFDPSICKEIVKRMKEADLPYMKVAANFLGNYLAWDLEFFFNTISSYVGIMAAMLTEKDKKILRDFASLDSRIEKLYEEWNRQDPVITAALGIHN